jgi:hypothetical protein
MPAGHARVASAKRLCSATSFVGVTAVAVHAGVFAALPQGVQVIARRFDAAQAIEDRIGSLPRSQEGFEVVSIVFLRSRVEQRAGNLRATLVEYRFRTLSAGPPP